MNTKCSLSVFKLTTNTKVTHCQWLIKMIKMHLSGMPIVSLYTWNAFYSKKLVNNFGNDIPRDAILSFVISKLKIDYKSQNYHQTVHYISYATNKMLFYHFLLTFLPSTVISSQKVLEKQFHMFTSHLIILANPHTEWPTLKSINMKWIRTNPIMVED